MLEKRTLYPTPTALLSIKTKARCHMYSGPCVCSSFRLTVCEQGLTGAVGLRT